jgi:prepilin signal peptidase PulO-like enzyme (type II secretory pathway)
MKVTLLAATGAQAAGAYFRFDALARPGMKSAMDVCLLLIFAVPITIMDIREYRIPDFLTAGGLLFFTIFNLIQGERTIGSLALACGLGFGLFWLIHLVSKGKMGLGDAKYSALLAVAAGVVPWLVTLFIASVAGLVFAAVMMGFFGMDRRARIPFAPFLTVGAVLAILLKGYYGGNVLVAL